jgi:hypothetical protein
MKAAERILPLLSTVRRIGDNRWISQCPAHQDRHPSLSVRQVHDRTLIRCWVGCTVEQIVASIGLTLADLYNDRKGFRPNPVADRRHLAVQGLETWRQMELQHCGEELRARDALLSKINMVEAGVMSEATVWIFLRKAYRGYSEVEDRFERLLRNQDTLQLWRESRQSRRRHE